MQEMKVFIDIYDNIHQSGCYVLGFFRCARNSQMFFKLDEDNPQIRFIVSLPGIFGGD